MAREAAYWVEFQKEAIGKELAREIPGYDVIEALGAIKILVSWLTKRQVVWQNQVIKEYWREDWGLVVYEAGEVLHRRWRLASDWEVKKWQDLPEEKLRELGVFREDGAFNVEIVEKIEDLPAAIRQLGRHIPAEKITRSRKKFELVGDAQILGGYANRLSSLLQAFLESPRPSTQLMESASREIDQITQILERSRTSLKRKALREARLAQQGKFWETAAQTGQAIASLLRQRAEDYEIAMKSIESAERLRDLMAEIERRFRNCYNRLGQLGQRLQELLAQDQTIEPKDLLSIANEASGIYKHLTGKVPNFNPYYQRLQAPEFQRLSRVTEHGRKGRAKTVFNDIEEAMVKLEAFAIGERPTRAELQKERQHYFEG